MPYVFAAYTIIWLGVLVYSLSLSSRTKKLAQDVDNLERLMREKGQAVS